MFAHARKSIVYAWYIAYSGQLRTDLLAVRRRISNNSTVHDPRQNRDSSHEWLKIDLSEQLSRVVCAMLRAKTRTDEQNVLMITCDATKSTRAVARTDGVYISSR